MWSHLQGPAGWEVGKLAPPLRMVVNVAEWVHPLVSLIFFKGDCTPYKVGPYLVISGVISQFIGVITQVTQLQVHL